VNKKKKKESTKKGKKKKKSSFVCVFIPSCLGFGFGVGLVFTYYSLVSRCEGKSNIVV
jgi:hypothetical protein